MLSYSLKCRKNAESKNPKVVKPRNGRIMLLSICEVFDSEKTKIELTKRIKKFY